MGVVGVIKRSQVRFYFSNEIFGTFRIDHSIFIAERRHFNAIEVSSIRIDDNLVERVRVAKEGNTLKIGLEPGRSYSLKNATLEVDVTMPELTGLDLESGSHATINGLRSTKVLDAKLSSGSHLQGDVDVGDAEFDLSGGSHVTLSGSAGDLVIDASGGSHGKLADLAVGDANVKANGGSHVTVNPSGSLNAVAKGGSHVRYVGSPTLGTINADVSSSFKQE